jgi:hypothetical protein
MSDTMPSHLDCLVPSEWGLWRWFVLRGAGFPAELVNQLALYDCASSADRLISADVQLREAFHAATRELSDALDRLSAEGKGKDDSYFKNLLSARRRLARGKLPRNPDLRSQFRKTFGVIEDLLRIIQHLKVGFETAFMAGLAHQSDVLRKCAADARFQEAVIWQNWRAFDTAIRPIAEQIQQSERNQRQRSREELIASYVQRYSVKNDSIGFFGPVAWGRVDENTHMMQVVAGPSLLKRRNTYFEDWAIDKIAERLSSLHGIDWWIPPRLNPLVSLVDGRLHRPPEPDVRLDDLEMTVLPLCDGKTLPSEILSIVRHQCPFQFLSAEQLREFLRTKVEEGVLTWRLLVPVEVNAEKELRRQLLRIGDSALREKSLQYLDQMESLRPQVATASGNPAQLSSAMQKLESAFIEITQSEGNRKPGTTYGGRTLVYEDCVRDLTLNISPQLLAPAVPALSLLLRSLRWLAASMAHQFDLLFLRTYQECSAASGSHNVPLLDWWLTTEPQIENASGLKQVEKTFQAWWTEILPIVTSERLLQFESKKLEEIVDAMFPHITTLSPIRYYCPDLMLAGTMEEVHHGKCLYVLGEVHVGKNTLTHVALTEQHPDPQQLMDAVEWDFGSNRFKIIETQESGTATVRTADHIRLPTDYFLATTPRSVAPSEWLSHPFSGLQLGECDGHLFVLDRRESRCFALLDAFADVFCSYVMNKASLFPPVRHLPRVLIDKVVIHRETWRFPVTELAFAMEKSESLRFLGARRWMRAQSIPRRAFVRSPAEVKPFYLDFDSPVLVEILCHAIRRMSVQAHENDELTFSEMLPDAEQAWLHDAYGARYTSELRMAIVDLKARERFYPMQQQSL